VNDDSYGIRLTDTAEGRNSASMLVKRMYARRGYTGTGTRHVLDESNRVTLTATDRGDVVGTVTIGIDSERGLMADELFKDILDEHRARGARLCECTKLAFDLSERSRVPLANVFHLALIYARDLYDCTDVVIEINPRHRRFYERMLGFRQQGELKINPRVNAPAYLLHLPLDYVGEQVERFGGTFDTAAGNEERSLYPYFFSPREERGIINRLLRMDEQNSSR
jgi:hypothetical protein